MKEKTLPWEDLQGKKIVTTIKSLSKPWVEKGAIVGGTFLIFGGIFTPYKIGIVLGLLIILARLMKKYSAFTTRGMEIFYDMLFTSSHTVIEWKDIDAVTYEKVKTNPDLELIYVTKGDITKKFYFKHKQTKDIIDFAKKCHPSVKIYDGEEYRKSIKNS